MKAYLYCTKAKPYLIHTGIRYDCTDKVIDLDLKALNGSVCFECEINKVEIIKHDNTPLGDDMYFTKSISIPCDFEKCTCCLSIKQLVSYSPNYALYLEKVKKIEPFTISKAPQNMCYITMAGERCVLISIQPEHLCNTANGIKDIEVRKSILNELKELIK